MTLVTTHCTKYLKIFEETYRLSCRNIPTFGKKHGMFLKNEKMKKLKPLTLDLRSQTSKIIAFDSRWG